MKKIILTAAELKSMEMHMTGKLGLGCEDEDLRNNFMSVIKKAEDLMRESNAYDEMGDNLILWFYRKYKAQWNG